MQSINTNNNFGALRLFFAFLVILSHSPELLDGNRNREFLSLIFGTISLGELAVDGFFLISGYLITQSYEFSKNLRSYLLKRVIRIYPAFIVASVICIVIVAPISGGWLVLSSLSTYEWIKIFVKMLFLKTPYVEGAFTNNPYPILNGAMWTIAYEFLCYLLVPVILFFFPKRKQIAIFTGVVFSIFILSILQNWSNLTIFTYFSKLFILSRFLCAFLTGVMFYKFKDVIEYKRKWLLISLPLLILFLFNGYLAELSLLILGGYLLFYFSFSYKNISISEIGKKTDISYGVYLYAWPFQNLVVQYYPNTSPLALSLATIIFVVIMGALSWRLVEAPFMKMKKIVS